MTYKISEIAKIANVSTRTLRYYDSIGLLKPSSKSNNQYRQYDENSINRLQLILLFRDIGMSLSQIQEVLEGDINYIELLENHKAVVLRSKRRLEQILSTITTTINYYKGESTMNQDDKFKGLKEELIQENETKYGTEIRDKYGDDTIDASYQKMRKMSKWEWQESERIGQEILEKLKVAMTLSPTSDEAIEVCQLHQKWIQFFWPTYEKQAHLNLVKMYTEDDRFRAYYDVVGDGASDFFYTAMSAYLNNH